MPHLTPGRRKALVSTALAAALSLPLAACGGGSGSGGDDKTVTIWTSVDQPILDGFESQLAPLAKDKGITVKWSKVENINQLIMTKIQANDAPDIAMIPQPGVVADIVSRGKATALDDIVDMGALQSSMLPGTLEAGTVDGKLYGLLVNSSLKSLVFYPKKAFDQAGYKVPKTLGDLEALTEQIKSDGGVPWCMGIGSEGGSTGWPATDWIEDLVGKYGGADAYNSWVSHDTPFDSDLVRQAAGEFEKLILTDGNTPGGRDALASTDFTAADDPMWDSKPGCWLQKQGTFITGFYPKDIQANLDTEVGVFGFPPATAGGENPVVGAGDEATLLSDKKAAADVMAIMAADDWGTDAAKSGAWLSPHKNFDQSLYPNNVMKTASGVATKSSAFLFDGSDQMPGAVGAGTFWKDMTAWISGQEDLDTALKNIDASWPTS